MLSEAEEEEGFDVGEAEVLVAFLVREDAGASSSRVFG